MRDRSRRWLAAFLLTAAVAGGAGAAPLLAAPAPPQQVSGDDVQLPVDGDADPEEVRDEARRILEQDRYQAPTQDRNVLQRVRDWIADRLPDLPSIDGAPREGGQDVLGVVTIIVIVALVGAGVAWVVVNTRRRRRGDDEDEATDADVDVEPLRSPTEWSAEAERCEREGEHRGAVRARFRATTTRLADRGLVADTPGRTAGELRADMAERAPAAVASFALLADLFERTWFGRVPAGPDDAATARRLADQVLEQAPRRRARADDEAEA